MKDAFKLARQLLEKADNEITYEDIDYKFKQSLVNYLIIELGILEQLNEKLDQLIYEKDSNW